MFQDVHKKIIISLKDEDLRNGSREATREGMKNRLDAIKRHPYAEDWAKEIKEIKRKLLLDPIKNFEDFGFVEILSKVPTYHHLLPIF